tara:strand:- start:1581 stop:2135 length:555 start_codon:yes stop_codon:yes gene_type:complete
MEIKAIEGVFSGYSGGVVASSSANARTKAINMHEVDYIIIDGVRMKNIVATGSVIDGLAKMSGEKIKVYYLENDVNGTKKRLLAGFEGSQGGVESIMEDDVKPTLKGVGSTYNIYLFMFFISWVFVGGVASAGISSAINNSVVGVTVFASGFVLGGMLIQKLKKKATAPLALLLGFAEKHDKSI